MKHVVLDATAVLALLQGERGADRVEAALHGAVIGAVNLAEVVGKLAEAGMSEEAVHMTLGSLELEVVPFDEDLAFRAGLLRLRTRSYGLSLGDRACLALAQRLGKPALTADRAWATLKLGIETDLIR